MPLTDGIEPFYLELGDRLARQRYGAGLSQGELGKRLNPQLSRASIANIETGKQRVLAHTLCQMAAALGVSVDDLLTPSSQPNAGSKIGSFDLAQAKDELVAELCNQLSDWSATQAQDIVNKVCIARFG
jgi:transcriptional regulator with XRE-family HTH domain